MLQQIIAMENGSIRQQGTMKEIKQKDNDLYESWKTAVENCRCVTILSASLILVVLNGTLFCWKNRRVQIDARDCIIPRPRNNTSTSHLLVDVNSVL